MVYAKHALQIGKDFIVSLVICAAHFCKFLFLSFLNAYKALYIPETQQCLITHKQVWVTTIRKEKCQLTIIQQNCIGNMQHNTLILLFLHKLHSLQLIVLAFRSPQEYKHTKIKINWNVLTGQSVLGQYQDSDFRQAITHTMEKSSRNFRFWWFQQLTS